MRPRSVNACSTGERKKQLRLLLRRQRDTLPETLRERKSASVARNLRRLPAYRLASTVMFYMTHGSEVRTEVMIEYAFSEGKVVVLPRVKAGGVSLSAVRIDSTGRGLKKGAYGIREPRHHPRKTVAPGEIDLVLVPAIAFDRRGRRLGYGKGCYDRLLHRFPPEKRVGLTYEAQFVGCLPEDEHDIPVGTVVTEKRIVNVKDVPAANEGKKGFSRAGRKNDRCNVLPKRKE
ncbi:MAG: 5-formyltetrahydrofolate cyclo-ligase [Endomicrobiales bacterium]